MGRRCAKASAESFLKLVFLHDESASGTSQRITGTDYKGETNALRGFHSFQEGVGNIAWGYFHPQLYDMVAEGLPVFSQFDGSDINPDQADIIFFPDTSFICFYREV